MSADVRSLAKESADSAEKIKDLVKRVQQQVAKVATDIEQAGNKARQEVESAKKSAANLITIQADFAEVQRGVWDITGASLQAMTAITRGDQGRRPDLAGGSGGRLSGGAVVESGR